MKKKEQIICVACPKGCKLEVVHQDNSILVSNASCKRGKEYGIREVTDPRRMVASTVKVSGGKHPLLPVYTSEPFPKGKIFELLSELRKVQIHAPIEQGDIILEKVLGTDISILASRDM
jgi:CxxC motif-containing protein